jgi:hypothetical protein
MADCSLALFRQTGQAPPHEETSMTLFELIRARRAELEAAGRAERAPDEQWARATFLVIASETRQSGDALIADRATI